MKNKVKHQRGIQVSKVLCMYNQTLTKNIKSKKVSDSCIMKIHEIIERVRKECIDDMMKCIDTIRLYARLTEPLYRYTKFLSRTGGILYYTEM